MVKSIQSEGELLRKHTQTRIEETNRLKIAIKRSANDIFGSVMQANPSNFPKYFAYQDNLGYNHTLFGNKGNGGFPNPYADMVKGYKDRFTNTIFSQVQIE